jgi:thioredoxin 1
MANLESVNEQEKFEAALKSDKPVVVDFYTQSCVICKKVEPMLIALRDGLDNGVDVIKIDAEANLAVAAKYNVRGVPTLMIFQDGELKERKSGFMTAMMLREWIGPFVK